TDHARGSGRSAGARQAVRRLGDELARLQRRARRQTAGVEPHADRLPHVPAGGDREGARRQPRSGRLQVHDHREGNQSLGGRPGSRLSLRVVLRKGVAFGPGKAELLEHIRDTGSIAAAGRRMKMSYTRAWGLVRDMNDDFASSLVRSVKGGSARGGAELTPLG